MDSNVRDDYLWLLSDDARPLLDQAEEDFRTLANALRVNKRLRKLTTPTRAALVIEQVQLRSRAKAKFENAHAMFFTRRALEQSTGARLSNYKATRFAKLNNVADVCCGIGGDLLPLAMRGGATVGLDADELTAMFARKNLEVVGATQASVTCDTFEKFDIGAFDGLHFDPDRRVTKRTVRGDSFTPKLSEIFARTGADQSVAIKVAPATPAHDATDSQAEIEWIGDNRECKQQVIWQGPATARPGKRTATFVTSTGEVHQFSCSLEKANCERPRPPQELGPAIYEPHPTVLAGGLVNALARTYNLRPVHSMIDYLTGVPAEKCRLLRKYRIDAQLKLNLKSLVKELRVRQIGKIVVKKRGVDQAIFDAICALKLSGENEATVIATRHNAVRLALITNVKLRM